ncbi:MAG: DUF86 domain-containing protein [Armatimonadetes bacterium]|nr:DUF86 domain-containing protein [Armatimonadota bacterium]
MKDDRLYLIHIGECIERIGRYVEDGEVTFMQSLLIQDAVLRNLQTLSESTQRLSDKQKELHPEIDWRRIAGFRNVIVHDYLGVDIPHVWDIIARELPMLKSTVMTMLEEI